MFTKGRDTKRKLTLLLAAALLFLPVTNTNARESARPVSRQNAPKTRTARLKLAPLPKRNGHVDARQIMIESAGVKQNFTRQLSGSHQRELSVIIRSLRNKQVASAQQNFRKFLERPDIQNGSMDINDLISHILRQSYLVTNKDLEFHAAKARHFNDFKGRLKNQVTKARSMKGRLNNCSSGLKKTFGNYIKEMQEELNTLSADAQLANMELQNILQEQQQTVQILSNVSKVLHDTAMSVIRNIG